MGSSAVGAKIAQNVFGRRDRQPGGECRRDGQLCSRREDSSESGSVSSAAVEALNRAHNQR